MDAPLLTTPLDAWHRRLGARMVPFAGYAMPVQYDFAGVLADRCRSGVLAEHLHCREKAALFDVSHMDRRCWKARARPRLWNAWCPAT